MSVDIEPSELSFRRPFTQEVQQTLTIRNPNQSPLAFKVKTTAPKQYCVRPNSGRIEPGEDVEVAVLLQAMKADPPADAKCRDKFLVQAVSISPAQEFSSVQEVLDSADKRMMQERKIRVNWLSAESLLDSVDHTPAISVTPLRPTRSHEDHDATPDVSRVFTSPSHDDTASGPNAPPPYSDEVKVLKKEVSEEPLRPSPLQSRSTSGSQPTYEELKAKLAASENIIEGLRQELQLRKRKGATENEKSTAPAQQATVIRQEPSGVPVKVVAILCFLTFLLSYIFF
ncbi:related to (VAMP)-associated protein [Cephalotrichum gorgonifer]|uniref:Related to (VAMP)-associated protein n=1 Tax=Cephalotrichum gorgonifer TaxID=2041049 RepID=A0AAE8MR93_9PEZI|nr:related to (VAMP)-associated protein [Cephalotrichum gorgonifer]